jgi:hypothetical protein
MIKKTNKTPIELNKLAAFTVGKTTDEEPEPKEKPTKNPAAVALGKLGGKKGGRARAEKLTPEQRSTIAKKAAHARWKKEQ